MDMDLDMGLPMDNDCSADENLPPAAAVDDAAGSSPLRKRQRMAGGKEGATSAAAFGAETLRSPLGALQQPGQQQAPLLGLIRSPFLAAASGGHNLLTSPIAAAAGWQDDGPLDLHGSQGGSGNGSGAAAAAWGGGPSPAGSSGGLGLGSQLKQQRRGGGGALASLHPSPLPWGVVGLGAEGGEPYSSSGGGGGGGGSSEEGGFGGLRSSSGDGSGSQGRHAGCSALTQRAGSVLAKVTVAAFSQLPAGGKQLGCDRVGKAWATYSVNVSTSPTPPPSGLPWSYYPLVLPPLGLLRPFPPPLFEPT